MTEIQNNEKLFSFSSDISWMSKFRTFEHSYLGFVSNFGFRASDFSFGSNRN
jgi:hypothetical protein